VLKVSDWVGHSSLLKPHMERRVSSELSEVSLSQNLHCSVDVLVLEREIVTGMQLMGVTKLDELKPEMVECLQEMWR
jgi:hypothetical protein